MPITINPPKTLPRIIHNLLLEISDPGNSTLSYRVIEVTAYKFIAEREIGTAWLLSDIGNYPEC
jgi:hypothetical protein